MALIGRTKAGIRNRVLLFKEEDTEKKTTTNAAKFQSDPRPEMLPAQDISLRFTPATAIETTATETRTTAQSTWRFNIFGHAPLARGSLILDIGGELFFDDGEGVLLRNYNTTTGTGEAVGEVNYSAARVEINDYPGRPLNATVTPIAALSGEDWSVIKSANFRTSAAPLRPNGFTVRGDDFETGEQYNAEADNQGTLSGDGVTGSVTLQDGIAELDFPAPVLASTVFYNAVSFKRVPLDPEILGLDPVRLPADGRVPIFRDADISVFTHTQKDLIASPTAGQVINAGRTELHDGWIEDQEGTRLAEAQFTLDKDAGTATLADPFSAVDEAGDPLTGDLFFAHRVDNMALVTEARLDGTLQLAQPLAHDLPANDTWAASTVFLGNLQGRVKDWASYTTDPGGFDNTGTATDAQYNLIDFPVAIDNRGSVPDRWKISFTSSTSFELISENRGLVATGNISTDFSPTNPQSGTPYFTIMANGWGAGWQVGNTVRFDTEGANAPLWLIRTVLPGQATVDDDQLKIELRGDNN